MVVNKEISLDNDTFKEQVLSLQNVIKGFRMTLEGYIWSGNKDDFVYTNKPLCDSRIIDLLVALISPFTHNANLITIKDFDTYIMQQYYIAREYNKILHTNPYSNTDSYTQVFLIADDTFQNVLDIILGSKAVVSKAVTADDNDRNLN